MIPDIRYYQIDHHGRQRIKAASDDEAKQIAIQEAEKYRKENWRLVKETREEISNASRN